MNQKLKIGYFADGPWSHNAFELLVNDDTIEIQFIVPRSDSQDDTLKKFAGQHGIEYLKGYNINSDEFYNKVVPYDCDLFVSMSFNQIFRKRIINLPRLKTINCHAGKLPFYRGRNILNWALINDEKEFGITVHYIDDGIDTGDIILQRSFPITEKDNYATLLETSFTECAQILYDALKLVQSGKADRINQTDIHPVGFYCGRRGEGDEIINWNQNSRVIFNFIRAICKPGPMATTSVRNQTVKINKSRLIKNAPYYINTIGQIVGKSNDGYIVKTLDSTLEIFEIESDIQLKIGDKLG